MRVRFAPSPTGFLHTGGARTALYNWLMARQSGGSFILRIEDTDEARSTEDSTRAILDGLAWLGLDWDEGPDPADFGESLGGHGPYFQSRRRERHLEVVRQLLESGHAFYCPATAEELTDSDGKKKLLSPYRDLTPEEQQKRLDAGEAMPVRLKCPLGEDVSWVDIVRGPVNFRSDEVGDFVIVKSSGQPLYNLAVTADDCDMEVSHVLRGEDHISNTPKQLLLYRALGWDAPVFGHLPLIVGMDRARLSKRHGATSVGSYRELGYLPEALTNFLLLIGWSPSGKAEAANQEVFTRDEMIRHFKAQEIGKSAGAFNMEKLDNMNGLYLRALEPAEFVERLWPFLPEGWRAMERAYLDAVLPLYQDKLVTLSEIEQNAWYFFSDPQEGEAPVDEETGKPQLGYYSEKAVRKFITENDNAAAVLGELFVQFEQLDQWTEAMARWSTRSAKNTAWARAR